MYTRNCTAKTHKIMYTKKCTARTHKSVYTKKCTERTHKIVYTRICTAWTRSLFWPGTHRRRNYGTRIWRFRFILHINRSFYFLFYLNFIKAFVFIVLRILIRWIRKKNVHDLDPDPDMDPDPFFLVRIWIRISIKVIGS